MAISLCALPLLFSFGALISIQINRGTLEIETFDQDVQVQISRDGEEITIVDTKTAKEIRLHAGEYQLAIVDGPDDLKLSTDTFELTRRGKVVVRVRRFTHPVAFLQASIETDHRDRINSIALAPDESLIATASFDGTIQIRDAKTLQHIRTLKRHKAHVDSVVFSTDGRTLATSGDDNTVRLWDVESGQPLAVLETPTSTRYACYSPDGKILASCGFDSIIRLWDGLERCRGIRTRYATWAHEWSRCCYIFPRRRNLGIRQRRSNNSALGFQERRTE